MDTNFTGTTIAVSIVTASRDASLRFYIDILGYQLIRSSPITKQQKDVYGQSLSECILIGHDKGSIIRLLVTQDQDATPNRIGASPLDTGLCVLEAGSPDVDKIYKRLIENRCGVISRPKLFSVEGPEPLGFMVMKAVGVFGPSGEQLFITQITEREGGTPLWGLRDDIDVFPPGNIVLSLKTREQQAFYKEAFGISPSIDLLLDQPEAVELMGGPTGMSFRMCLMGSGMYKTGMEQHVYGPLNPNHKFKKYPSDFSKTGLASACWKGQNLEDVEATIIKCGGEVISDVLLPLRDNDTPSGVIFRGKAGEIVELAA